MDLNCGIYKITNTQTGDFYIGQSINLKQRFRAHIMYMKKGSHKNSHLQNSFNKYGEDCFKFEVLLYCEPFELTRYEQGLVDKLKPTFNKRIECVNSPKGLHYNLGRVHSEEVRSRMGNRTKHTAWNKGKSWSDETKLKMSEVRKGRPLSEENKNRISNSIKLWWENRKNDTNKLQG